MPHVNNSEEMQRQVHQLISERDRTMETIENLERRCKAADEAFGNIVQDIFLINVRANVWYRGCT